MFVGPLPVKARHDAELREIGNARGLYPLLQKARNDDPLCPDHNLMQSILQIDHRAHFTRAAYMTAILSLESDPELATYLRPMIVSTTVSNVLEVVGGGAGAGVPLIGISPARTVTDNKPVSATANAKRFMF